MKQNRIISYLKKLKSDPPHFIIFEGGDIEERKEIALSWATLVNCKNLEPPCKRCDVCLSFIKQNHKELFFLEADEDKTIKIEDISRIKNTISYRPEGCDYRIFIISQSHRLTLSACNSLLKLLEEPPPFNLFVFLTPHRTLLLPTIVSRSYIFTLTWKKECESDKRIREWAEKIFQFWINSKGLFDEIERVKIDRALLNELAIFYLKEIVLLLTNKKTYLFSKTEKRLDIKTIFKMIEMFNKVLELSQANVSPTYIIHWIAIRGFLLFNTNR